MIVVALHIYSKIKLIFLQLMVTKNKKFLICFNENFDKRGYLLKIESSVDLVTFQSSGGFFMHFSHFIMKLLR